jgi:hypothetical protein
VGNLLRLSLALILPFPTGASLFETSEKKAMTGTRKKRMEHESSRIGLFAGDARADICGDDEPGFRMKSN